ncbi:nucleotide exchange factor GrpE [Gammaproteobacteria bacterium 45_16_T64]|nr:nucleotide exchange factor GrpE [Gammaproteobacteria bacterium 45_16_T64]
MSSDEATSPEQEESIVAETEAQETEVSDVESEAGTESEEGTAEDVSIEQLQAQLAAAQAKVQDQQDSVLRSQAEMQNVRRRAERDVENAHKFALEKFATDLLPVVDTLERALQSVADAESESGVESTREGVELTLKMLSDTLTKHGVVQVDPVGEPFNPEFHQAMSMQPNPDMEPNTVMAVLQKGYTLSGRLARPAMVIVSKA